MDDQEKLRNLIAAAAMQGLIAHYGENIFATGEENSKRCYKLADQMITASEVA